MPKAINVVDFPAVVRTSADSQYAELVTYTQELCQDVRRRTTEAFQEGVESDEAFAKTAQAIRNAAKAVGAKVQIVYSAKSKVLTCRYVGQYVTLSDDQKAAKAASRKANAEKVATAGVAAKKAASQK
jgi:hypothetical protein